MVQIDDFESQFRRADKAIFDLESPRIRKIALILDCEDRDFEGYLSALIDFLSGMLGNQADTGPSWERIPFEIDQNVSELRRKVEASSADLIITWRHLFKEPVEGPIESLGIFVDCLAQSTQVPVLLIPRGTPEQIASKCPNTKEVMVLSDNLVRDSHLISVGLHFTEGDGSLFLANIEDGRAFDRYMNAIQKIPGVNSEMIHEELKNQLFKETTEFTSQVLEKIRAKGSHANVKEIFRFGSSVKDFRKLLDEHGVDLLVLNTKDDTQLAMHGLAYPVAVEFTEKPILML